MTGAQWEQIIAALSARSDGFREGVLRWVPVEPTRDMEHAGILRSQEHDIFGGVRALTFADCAKIYRAMVEAAPLQQPEEPESGQ